MYPLGELYKSVFLGEVRACDVVFFTLLYFHVPYHNDTRIKQTQEDFSNKIFTSHFIARVRKGLLKVCVWEGAGDRTETVIFWPPLLWPSTLCLSRSPDAQPEALGSTLLGAGFLYCISIFSGPQFIRAQSPFCLVWLSLPHLVSNWHWNCKSTVLTSVLTELYNSSTPTRSPTQSLKSHV